MKFIIISSIVILSFCNFIFNGLSRIAVTSLINTEELVETQNIIIPNSDNQTETEKILLPDDIPNCLTFWDFQEKAGKRRISKGKYNYALEEMNGPVKRVKDGVFGPYSADIVWGQWFRIKREIAPGLDLHGDQQVTMVAWVKRESDRVWQYIAGMWNEGTADYRGKTHGDGEGAPARQYAIFINGAWQTDYTTYERIKAENQTHGYISSTGGATPGSPFAFDYATGGTHLEKNRWYMIAYTYDGESIRVYVDGKLDRNGNYNPFIFDGRIYDGGKNGSDFTVALRHVPGWPSYPDGVPENDAGFDGRLGGLAVYDRALNAEEISKLYNSTMNKNHIK